MPHVPCDACKKKITMNAETTLLHVYEKQMWFNWAETICPLDGESHSNFVSQEVYRILVAAETGAIYEDFAPEEIVEEYCRIMGLSPVQIHELTQRHEELVAKLADILTHMPDSDIIAELELPEAPHRLNERWA